MKKYLIIARGIETGRLYDYRIKAKDSSELIKLIAGFQWNKLEIFAIILSIPYNKKRFKINKNDTNTTSNPVSNTRGV